MTAQGTMLTDEAIREAAVSHVAFYCDVEQGALEPETRDWAEGIYVAGARFARDRYEADRAKLLDRVAELEADNQVLRDAVAVAIPMIAKSELAEWEKLLGGINPPIPLPEKGDAG